jgi:integrase-like protein
LGGSDLVRLEQVGQLPRVERLAVPVGPGGFLDAVQPLQQIGRPHVRKQRNFRNLAVQQGSAGSAGSASAPDSPQVGEQAQNGALAPLKTAAFRRTVSVGDWALKEIGAHLQRYGPGPGQVVMSNAGGRIIRRNAFGDAWRAAVKTAGLPTGTRFHDLRHFYASTLIAANLNPKVIQARLGHATIAETVDTYGHLFPDSEDLGRTAVDDALAGALAEQERNSSAR